MSPARRWRVRALVSLSLVLMLAAGCGEDALAVEVRVGDARGGVVQGTLVSVHFGWSSPGTLAVACAVTDAAGTANVEVRAGGGEPTTVWVGAEKAGYDKATATLGAGVQATDGQSWRAELVLQPCATAVCGGAPWCRAADTR